jgi:hypothetical protein
MKVQVLSSRPGVSPSILTDLGDAIVQHGLDTYVAGGAAIGVGHPRDVDLFVPNCPIVPPPTLFNRLATILKDMQYFPTYLDNSLCFHSTSRGVDIILSQKPTIEAILQSFDLSVCATAFKISGPWWEEWMTGFQTSRIGLPETTSPAEPIRLLHPVEEIPRPIRTLERYCKYIARLRLPFDSTLATSLVIEIQRRRVCARLGATEETPC